ncbi:MAG TPA: M48 family metalloprotease [Gammaproteobacteria bacterium]|nr:M48 family metalloprotease [Gammaproteobacteria bacterium]
MNMLMRMLLAVLVLSLAGCRIDLARVVDNLGNMKTATVGVDAEEEAAIGFEAAATLLGAAPLLDDKEMQRYVNRVGRWVAMQSARPGLPWRFAVIDHPGVNAFAAPGGYVFITRGLLMQLRSEAELAGVLGHEIAHVVRRHHLEALKQQARLALAGSALAVALEQRGRDANDYAWVTEGAKTLYTRGLDRDDELEADRLGVVLAARAGYDPYGLLVVLQRLDAMAADDSRLALLFKTHPAPADRLEELAFRMDGRMDGLAAVDGAERFGIHVQRLGAGGMMAR